MHRVVGVVVMAVGAACGSADDAEEVRGGAEPVGASGDERTIYRGSFTVLEVAANGPQLCGAMVDAFPPDCSGPDVIGWSWDEVDGEESVGGTTWGDYEVTGTWDGEQLTLTEPPGPPDWAEQPEPDFATPCPEPEGGWAVVDPATATRAALEAAVEQARRREDFAGVWVDNSEALYDDPTKVVLNVRVTGDVGAAEVDLRETWGGALCVSSGNHTAAELRAIQDEIDDEMIGTNQFLSSGQAESEGVVHLQVYVEDGLQAELDDRYGPGVVAVTARLQPVD